MKFIQQLFSSFILLLGFTLPTLLFAAGGHESHGPGWSFIFKWVNFVIAVGIIFVVAKKRLPELLQQRSDSVASAIEDAKRQEAAATALLKDYESKIAELSNETKKMIHEAKQRAEREKERIIDEAHQEANHIVDAARLAATRLEAKASAEAENILTAAALNAAEQKARQVFADAYEEKQKSLVNTFVEGVRHEA